MKKTYEFENLGCAHCAGKMEEKIGKLPEVESVNLSFPMKKMYVETSSEDLLPEIQKICTDIEPDVIVTEVLKKSSKKRKDEEVHEEHCGCGCESEHEGHEHHHHQHHHDRYEHHHHHDEDHCDCDCCDDDDDDEGTIAAAQNAREMERQRYLLLRNLAVHIVQVKWKNRFHICQELRQ